MAHEAGTPTLDSAKQFRLPKGMELEFLRRRAEELWLKAQRHHFSGQLERAIQLYTRSIDTFPTPEAYTYRGWAYSSFGRFDEAIAECKHAIEIDPEFGNSYNDIGSYLVAKNNLDAAIEWFDKAKLADRYDARHFPYMNLGRVYASRGMIKQAIQEFEGALKHAPGEPTCVGALSNLRRSLN